MWGWALDPAGVGGHREGGLAGALDSTGEHSEVGGAGY